MSDLLLLADAQARLLALGTPLEKETLPVAEAAGRWLAEDIRSLRTQPATDLSAMDGYAVRYDDLPGPATVIGESAAGSPFDKPVAAGQAVRIFTGAAVPEGADTVMVQEEAARDGDRLRLDGEGPTDKGANIRKKGRDFSEGDILVAAGKRLTARCLALAIAGGHGEVTVRRKPKVAILSTGDELVLPGIATGSAQIPASNGPMLIAQLAGLPVEIVDYGIVPDNEEILSAAIEQARATDIIVTIGGASVGDRDLVLPVLKAAGAKIDFWRIAIKPGKPLMAGTLGNAIALALPGNPASAFVTAKLFLEPLIAHLSGDADPLPRFMRAPLAADMPASGEREEYVRGKWQNSAAEPLDQQSSAALVTLADAELLIRRLACRPPAMAGEIVEILPLT